MAGDFFLSRLGLRPFVAGLVTAAALAPLAACTGDAGEGTDAGADAQEDANTSDASITNDANAFDGARRDSALGDDANSDASSDSADAGIALDTVFPAIAPGRSTRLYNVTHDAQGNVYATGQVAVTAGGDDFATLLVKFLPTGQLDTSFGTGGVVETNVAVGGSGEVARGIALQGTKIVVGGKVEHGTATQSTRDVTVLRFLANGMPDTSFGTNGVKRIELGDGELVDQYGLGTYANGDLLVVATRKASAGDAGTPDGGDAGVPAVNEYAVLRLAEGTGAFVTTFGQEGSGIFSVGLATNISPRTPTILSDGSALIAGYTNSNGQKPVVVKITPAGTLDTSFATGGVFFPESGVPGLSSNGSAEVYGAALQGTKFVTTGYGKENASQPAVGWISLRLEADGGVDTTYGDAGHVFFGVNEQAANSRALVVLGDERVLLLGGASPAKPSADAGTQSQYAALAVLRPNGALDPAYNPSGPRLFDLGGPATGRAAHMFWAGSLSPDKKHVAIVGIRGGVVANADAGTAGTADQAVFLSLPTGN